MISWSRFVFFFFCFVLSKDINGRITKKPQTKIHELGRGVVKKFQFQFWNFENPWGVSIFHKQAEAEVVPSSSLVKLS